MNAHATLEFVLPGDPETRTGGYEYDRRIVAGLRALGRLVRVHSLAESFPFPSTANRDAAQATFARLPDGALVVVDGLAYGALPDVAAREATRLRLVALVHHPLAAETGLAPDAAARLHADEREALAHARAVIATGGGTADVLARDYGVAAARLAIVEPGTDPAPLARGSTGRGRSPGDARLRLLCVATLTPRKGHDVLLDALADLRALDWELDCVGSTARDPATAARIAARVRALGLDGRVRLRGELDAPALADAYDAADAFVLAACHEGYGMAVAEALARGLPVVATRVGAIPALVGADAGLVVAPGDVPPLRDALDALLRDRSRRARLAAGAARARERLPGWDAQCDRFARVLESVA